MAELSIFCLVPFHRLFTLQPLLEPNHIWIFSNTIVHQDYHVNMPGEATGGKLSVGRIDPRSQDQQPTPGDPTPLPRDQARAKLRGFDYPGENTRRAVMNYLPVRDAYLLIRREGTATRDELVGLARSSTVDDPDRGLFPTKADFYREVMAPALESMPDIDSPPERAGVWKYSGIKPNPD
ncbi:hypothetical protein G3I44_10930 [Halogeometricum borinquense]|uniref:Uncharacterized protein n=1 Tax=Halogeometricum borinquense TaxID=60847 RepID=A0A6C0UGT7_9EURY|nr:hypothetical protein [Halogeometricum borinquense]QIB74754.1 hypothetical protein G3I44_10930 [Halogeometricum borinquense]